MQINSLDDIIDRIDPSERIGACGPTRCGKSRTVKQIIKHFDNVVVTAAKREWDWDLEPVADPKEWERKVKFYSRRAYTVRELDHELDEVERLDNGEPIVFLPERLENRIAHRKILDYPFHCAIERGNTFSVADDLFYHAHGTNFETAAPWYFYVITSGGGRGCGCASLFQRPVWVPKVALSETEHFLVWYLQEQEDRDAIDARAGKERGGKSPIDWAALRDVDHSFVYFTKRYVSEPLVIEFEKEAA